MSKKVLVVDDSAIVRQQVRFALGEAGFQVVEAEDGEQGLKLALDTPDFAMLVCDVNMPKMSGIEMLEKLKASLKRPMPPVLMLTTEGAADLISQAKSYGAKGWMVKPFKPEQLIAVAKKLTATPA